MAVDADLPVAFGKLESLLSWAQRSSLWLFPMATSCCGIELMAAAAARVDLDRMGAFLRGTPRQSDVMVVAGTITVKMAPRVKKLWDQMPEPKWCVAMGSCAISGDFYRDIYSVIPGIDTVIPVDVYIPGCPPNPEGLMQGLLKLQEKVKLRREEKVAPTEGSRSILPAIRRVADPARDPEITARQHAQAASPGDAAGESALPLPLPVVEVAAEAPAPVPGADFAALLRERFGVEALPKDAPPLIPVERLLELAVALREAGYTLFSYVVASHWPPPPPKNGAPAGEEAYELAYGVRRPAQGAELATWRVRLGPQAEVPTLAAVYAGADWQEREQYDLVGVRFVGHPDLRRIMLPQNWEGHPLRRDYPIDKACAPWR
jgi:NADH-quinone oxidoreductase B subunit